MSVAREKLKKAFIDLVVPELNNRDFRGIFPNYRRYMEQQIDIISLQFSIFDEAFCIGVAKCPTDGVTYSNGKRILGDLVTANHCPQRFMLGTQAGDLSHWFKFNPSPWELNNKHKFSFLTMYEDSLFKYKKIVDDIVRLIELQAEPWWRSSQEWWNYEVPVYQQLFFDIQNLKFKQLYY